MNADNSTTAAAEDTATETLRLGFVFDDGGTGVRYEINQSRIEDAELPWNEATMVMGSSGISVSAGADDETNALVTRVADLGIGVRTTEDSVLERRVLDGSESFTFTLGETARLQDANTFGMSLEHLLGTGDMALDFYQDGVQVETASYALSSPLLVYELAELTYRADIDHAATAEFDTVEVSVSGTLGFEISAFSFLGEGAVIPNVAPESVDDSTFTQAGEPVTIDVLANDVDATGAIDPTSLRLDAADDATAFTRTVSGEGVWALQLDDAGLPDGQLTFTPQAGFIGTATSVGYTVADTRDARSDIATVTVKVSAPIDPNAPVDPTLYDTIIEGPEGKNTLNGTDGNDYIIGNTDADNINGAGGNDYIIAGGGNDWSVYGGTGADIFLFQSGDFQVAVRDFEDGVDLIHLGGGLTYADLTVRRDVANSTVTYLTAEGDRLKIQNVDTSVIGEEDFVTIRDVVEEPNVAPTAGADSVTTLVDTAITIDVLDNDSDSDGTLDATSVQIVGAVGDGKSLAVTGEGTWSVGASGAITFTFETGYSGSVTDITYQVADNEGALSNAATVSVQIEDTATGGGATDPASYANQIIGDDADDRLNGTDANEYIFGGGAKDIIIAGGGDDLIDAGAGADWNVYGGEGADIFIFGAGSDILGVRDFEDGVDRILLTGGLSYEDLSIRTNTAGTNMTFRTDDGDQLQLRDIDITVIDQNDFI